MVRHSLFIFLLLIPTVNNADQDAENGITAERLRQIASDAEREKRFKASRVDPDNMASFLDFLNRPDQSQKGAESPEMTESMQHQKSRRFDYSHNPDTSMVMPERIPEAGPEKQQKKAMPVRSGKYSQNTKAPVNNVVATQIPPKGSGGNQFTYIPPARAVSNNTASNYSDAGKKTKRRFGIRIGTWIKGRLGRSTTNSDPGLIEIHITEDVSGDYRTLPSGTIFFCQKQFNPGTRRLDLEILKALLPSGDEIELTALVYDVQREAGLRGIVVENENRSVATGMVNGVLNAGRRLASLGADNTAGIIIDSTVGSVTEDQKEINEAKKPTIAYTIHVPPQGVLVQIQTTF